MARSGCAACGRVFSSLTAFDRHQRVAYGQTRPVECCNPAELGMLVRDGYIWYVPPTESDRLRLDRLKRR